MGRRRKELEEESATERCAWSGCGAPAPHRAPRSPDRLHEYQYFCLDHVKEFNKQWNYFNGMNDHEVVAFQKDAMYGHRPTWKSGVGGPDFELKLENAFRRMMGEAPLETPTSRAKPKDREALAVLDLEHPVSKKEIKKRYKELVKKYHPDVNIGDTKAEDMFKRVAFAYDHLMTHYEGVI